MRTNTGRWVAAVIILGIVIGSWWMTHSYIIRHKTARHVAFNLAQLQKQENIVPIAIIGSGCAGLSAAVYGARSHYYTVVFEGQRPGGQLTTTTWVENWPSYDKILGTDIIKRLRAQAESFGARIVSDVITHVDVSEWPYTLTTQDGVKIKALTVICAMGANPRKLGVSGEETYWGRGVTTCAICDAPFYKDSSVVVIGGGDSAVEESMQLAPYAKNITILVRGERMRASAAMQNHLKKYPHISVKYSTSIKEIEGDGEHVNGVLVKVGDAQDRLSIDGVFLAIGHEPNVAAVKDAVKLDEQNYIVLGNRTQETSVPGVFAAGDVADHRYRQAGVAAGDGIKAALDAADMLRSIGFNETVSQEFSSHYFDKVATTKRLNLQVITTLAEYAELEKKAENKITVLDFYTEYCPSCLQMLPLVEQAAFELQDQISVAKVDALYGRELAEKFVVPTVPMLLILKNGKVIARSKDIMSYKQLLEFIKQTIS